MKLPEGYRYSAIYAGIRKIPKDDLALIVSDKPASAAAVFTQNRVQAAPVKLCRRHLSASRGAVGAILVNAGNANCATRTGDAVALACCRSAARLLRLPVTQVLPASTGVIGVPLPLEKILRALPLITRHQRPSARSFAELSLAICTTDTRPKTASASFKMAGKRVHFVG